MTSKLFDPVLSRLQNSLDLRLKQQGLVSSNIANSNTPGYHAQRVDFKAAFDRVFSEGLESGPMMRAARGRHMLPEDSESAPVRTIKPQAWAEDGNSVNAEEEMVILAENNLLYNATIEVLKRRLGMLEYAASDGGR